MKHPYELLADLLDGTLDEGDLAGVQAHLDTCSSCREDVAHATAGREAARSLPQATAPTELHQRIVAAAGGHGAPGQGVPRWYRWAGVAAAAAVVVAIAIALPNVGGGGTDRANEAAQGPMMAGAEGQDAASGRQVEIRDVDYDAKGLEQLARAAGSDPAAQVEANATTPTDAAATCVSRAFDEQPVGRLARLIQARFEGRDAYIAIYLEGPGANEPPDTAVVWVAAKDDCSILSFASARI
jgi:anti-sigma factor RsiW